MKMRNFTPMYEKGTKGRRQGRSSDVINAKILRPRPQSSRPRPQPQGQGL